MKFWTWLRSCALALRAIIEFKVYARSARRAQHIILWRNGAKVMETMDTVATTNTTIQSASTAIATPGPISSWELAQAAPPTHIMILTTESADVSKITLLWTTLASWSLAGQISTTIRLAKPVFAHPATIWLIMCAANAQATSSIILITGNASHLLKLNVDSTSTSISAVASAHPDTRESTEFALPARPTATSTGAKTAASATTATSW